MTEQRKSYGELTRRDFLSMSAAFFGMAAIGGARAAGGGGHSFRGVLGRSFARD